MNKSDFISSVAEKSGLTKADAKKAVDAFCETVTEVLKAGDKLALLGFGIESTDERTYRNRCPQGGQVQTRC